LPLALRILFHMSQLSSVSVLSPSALVAEKQKNANSPALLAFRASTTVMSTMKESVVRCEQTCWALC
jgi:hypothetical protein